MDRTGLETARSIGLYMNRCNRQAHSHTHTIREATHDKPIAINATASAVSRTLYVDMARTVRGLDTRYSIVISIVCTYILLFSIIGLRCSALVIVCGLHWKCM